MDRIPVSFFRHRDAVHLCSFGLKKERWPCGHLSFYRKSLGLLLEVANSVVNLLAVVLAVKQQREVVGTQP